MRTFAGVWLPFNGLLVLCFASSVAFTCSYAKLKDEPKFSTSQRNVDKYLFFFRQDFNCQCRANFRCYYYGYYGRKCCGWVYQQPGCSRCQESQCCSNNVCKPLRKPGQACPLKGVITTDIMHTQQVKVDPSRLTLTRPFHLRSCLKIHIILCPVLISATKCYVK